VLLVRVIRINQEKVNFDFAVCFFQDNSLEKEEGKE
jgi:hypothetical protein